MKNNGIWWYNSIPSILKSLGGGLTNLPLAFDIKYGNYDYYSDLRYFTSHEFEDIFSNLIQDIQPTSNVLLCGSGNGIEIKYLTKFGVTALDISVVALNNLSKIYPGIKTINGNMNKLPFPNNIFDAYINLRSIQSYGVDIRKALIEADRVLLPFGKIIISIPDGYVFKKKIIKGIFVIDTYDLSLPFKLVNKIFRLLEQMHYTNINITKITSEIFITANKHE